MSESDLMRRLQMAATKLGARLFRQNVGLAWVGDARRFSRREYVLALPGDVLVRRARPFHAGIAGMSDLGGWVPVTVTHQMVGATVAVYLQVEVKENARATKEQTAWIEAVQAAGGRAGIARSDDDLSAIIRG